MRFYWRKSHTYLWHAYVRQGKRRDWADNYVSACGQHSLYVLGGATRPQPPRGWRCGICALAVTGTREGSEMPR